MWRRGRVALIRVILLLLLILLIRMLGMITLIILLRIVRVLRPDLDRVGLIVGRVLGGGGGGVVALGGRGHRGRGHGRCRAARNAGVCLLRILTTHLLLDLLIGKNLNHLLNTFSLLFFIRWGMSVWSSWL